MPYRGTLNHAPQPLHQHIAAARAVIAPSYELIDLCVYPYITSQTTTTFHGACTDQHAGTSAAAPLAAGMLALVLEAKYDGISFCHPSYYLQPSTWLERCPTPNCQDSSDC